MLKLFISLYFMVLASFFLFIYAFSNIDNMGRALLFDSSVEEKVSIGTFVLLNQAIDGLNKEQRKAVVAKYKKIFGNDFDLIELSSKDFSESQIATLNNGKIVIVDENTPIVINTTPDTKGEEPSDKTMLYFKVPNSSLVWKTDLSINIEQSFDENGMSSLVTSGTFSEGIFYLMEERLKDHPETLWPSIIKDLQKIQKIPIRIKPVSLLKKISQKQRKSIDKGEIINITQKTKVTTFVHRIFDSSWLLQIGPVEIPWYLRNFLYLVLFIFVMSFATMLLLWTWPLWSSLTKLRKASDRFGNGDYDTRIPYTFLSPIAKVNAAFNAMAERTQRGIKTQKELTSAVSHELRTPVARMRFALEMLNESDNKADSKRFINDINTDIDELDMLLEELLTYARLDHDESGSKQQKLGSVRLQQWFEKSMKRLEPLADDKNLSYHIQGISKNESALIEPRLMSRVLDNLVQNAIRYAHQTIKVTLTKESYKNKSDFLMIVEDDGEGIPKEKQAHIFDAFSRIDESRDRASGGFGLGLAIANRIVRNHQGKIELHQSILGGAKFVVRISLKS